MICDLPNCLVIHIINNKLRAFDICKLYITCKSLIGTLNEILPYIIIDELDVTFLKVSPVFPKLRARCLIFSKDIRQDTFYNNYMEEFISKNKKVDVKSVVIDSYSNYPKNFLKLLIDSIAEITISELILSKYISIFITQNYENIRKLTLILSGDNIDIGMPPNKDFFFMNNLLTLTIINTRKNNRYNVHNTDDLKIIYDINQILKFNPLLTHVVMNNITISYSTIESIKSLQMLKYLDISKSIITHSNFSVFTITKFTNALVYLNINSLKYKPLNSAMIQYTHYDIINILANNCNINTIVYDIYYLPRTPYINKYLDNIRIAEITNIKYISTNNIKNTNDFYRVTGVKIDKPKK